MNKQIREDTEMSFQQRNAVQDVVLQVREGLRGNAEMLKYLREKGGFSEQEAIYILGVIKDNREMFTR